MYFKCEKVPVPTATLEEEHAKGHAIGIPHMTEQPPASVKQPTSATEQHPKRNQEPARATTLGQAETYGPEQFEPGMAVGAECMARAEMLAAEAKSIYKAVTPLIHCPDLEEPPTHLATLQQELPQVPTINVPGMPCQRNHLPQCSNQLWPLSNIMSAAHPSSEGGA